MQILVVAATYFEIKPLLEFLKTDLAQEKIVTSASFKEHKVDILLTGVGMVSTAYHCAKHVSGKYDLVINAGICGSFNRNLRLGEVVNVYEDTFSELGAEDGDQFLDLNAIGLNGIQKISNVCAYKQEVLNTLPKVTGITVNTTHGSELSINKIFDCYHPYVESMEGAAFMFVCEQEKVSYIQIRAVSNYVEKRNKAAWDIPLAIENLNTKLIELLRS